MVMWYVRISYVTFSCSIIQKMLAFAFNYLMQELSKKFVSLGVLFFCLFYFFFILQTFITNSFIKINGLPGLNAALC